MVLEGFAKLSSRKERVALGVTDFKTQSSPLCLPHSVQATLLLTYPDEKSANAVERRMRDLAGKSEIKWRLELISDRPPLRECRANDRLVKLLAEVARKWDLPFDSQTSTWPSVAGLVPRKTAVVCGVGPVAENLYTIQESVDRISLVQRTLLLTQFLSLQAEQ
jgi:D-alanine-D-alanine ligase